MTESRPRKLMADQSCLFCGRASDAHPVSTGSGVCSEFRCRCLPEVVPALVALREAR